MIYIILPTHNRIEETKKFIRSLKQQAFDNYQLIVVDDGCNDGTYEFIVREIPGATILKGNGNLWWAGSLEMARKHLIMQRKLRPEDIVLIANDDVTLDANFLDDINKDMESNRDALILAKCYDQISGELLDKGAHIDWKSFTFRPAESPEDINVLSTRGLFMSFQVFCKIGSFHPAILPHYGSDYEFTHRAFKKGFPLKAARHAKIYLNTETTGICTLRYDQKLLKLLENLFTSKKSVYNRIMWTNFIILSCDRKYVLKNILRVHLQTVLILGRWLLNQTSKARLLLTVKIKRVLKRKIKIVLGAGGIYQSGWVPTGRGQLDITNRQSWLKYFAPETIDALLAEHVWEHLTADEARLAIENCKEFLKKTGYIRVAVPDGYFPDKQYINDVKPMGSGPGSHDHKVLYMCSSLSALFTASGFTVKLLEYWDKDGTFHAEKWEANDGLIHRSLKLDTRNLNGKIKYTSIIIDAIKS